MSFTPAGGSLFICVDQELPLERQFRPPDPLAGPPIVLDAGLRLYLDVTPLLRNKMGRRLLIGAAGSVRLVQRRFSSKSPADPHLRSFQRSVALDTRLWLFV